MGTIRTMSSRYLTSDPTQSLALTRDGRPEMDFAAAPSVFLEEDIRQENLLLAHRQQVCQNLQEAENKLSVMTQARIDNETLAERRIAEERAAAAAAAAEARRAEATAVEARRAQDCAYCE